MQYRQLRKLSDYGRSFCIVQLLMHKCRMLNQQKLQSATSYFPLRLECLKAGLQIKRFIANIGDYVVDSIYPIRESRALTEELVF